MPYDPNARDEGAARQAMGEILILIGSVHLLGIIAMAIAHYGFGVPIRGSGGTTEDKIALTVVVFLLSGSGTIALGRYLLKSATSPDE